MSKILKLLFKIILIFLINQNDSFILNNNNNNIYKNKFNTGGGIIFVESLVIKWNATNLGLDFTDPGGWFDNMVPTEEDEAIIDIEEIYVVNGINKVSVGSLELGSKVLIYSTEHFQAKNYITIKENSKMVSVHTSSPLINNYGKYHGIQPGSQIKSSVLNSYNNSETLFSNQNSTSPFLNSIANIYHNSTLGFLSSNINLSNTTFNLFDKSTCKFNKSQSSFCNTIINDESNFYILEGEYIVPFDIQVKINDKSNFFIEKSKFTVQGELVGTKSTIDFESYQSKIIIRDGGNFIINMKTQCRDTALLIKNDSSLTITSNGGEMVLRNTSFINKFGTVTQQGNIYLNSGSYIANHGDSKFNLFSTIYSSGDKNSNFTNNGTIFISNTNNILKIESPIINYGNIVTEFKQEIHVTSYIQYNGSSFNLQDESVINSNQPIQVEGGSLYGNATINTSIIHNYGILGSDVDTCYLYINGDYTLGQYGTIVVLINSIQDFTQIYIKDNAVLKGDLEVKISNKISSKNLKQLDVINFGELDKYSNAFKKVRFKTFDPETGREKDGNDCAQSISTDRSFSVLFRDCESPLSNGAIIGFCVGLVGAGLIAGLVYNFRKKISSTFNNTRITLIKKYGNNNNSNNNDNSNSNNNSEELNNSISLEIINDNNSNNNNNDLINNENSSNINNNV